MKLMRHFLIGVLPWLALPAFAGDFDGSKPLICATVATMDCMRGEECLAGLPEDIAAPAFMRIDFARKAVVGPKTTSPILLQEKSEDQLLLQGREGGFGWTIVLDGERGEMTATLTNRDGAYVLYGNCTPL